MGRNTGIATGGSVSRLVARRALPFILGIIAGLLVISAASISLAMLITHSYLLGSPAMMQQWQQLLLQNKRIWFAEMVSLISLAAGVAILAGSFLLYARPGLSESWGYLILMGSVTSLFWLGGFLIGSLLGIIAGVVVLYQAKTTARMNT